MTAHDDTRRPSSSLPLTRKGMLWEAAEPPVVEARESDPSSSGTHPTTTPAQPKTSRPREPLELEPMPDDLEQRAEWLARKCAHIDESARARRRLMEARRAIGEPLLLVTQAHPQMLEHAHANLGRLATPRHWPRMHATAAAGIPWAADNDCFQGLDADAYYRMTDGLPIAGALFVTVPDVVADARATAHRFECWSSNPRRHGLPVALVAQDGIEELGAWLAYSWHRVDALFIGGSTEWKMGPAAAAIAREAYARGVWVHWGRVNTARRLEYVRSTGAADSFDGSKWARFRTTYLDAGLELTRRPAQTALELER